jgi:hypothetical protein
MGIAGVMGTIGYTLLGIPGMIGGLFASMKFWK